MSEERKKKIVIFVKPDIQELKGSYYQWFQVPVKPNRKLLEKCLNLLIYALLISDERSSLASFLLELLPGNSERWSGQVSPLQFKNTLNGRRDKWVTGNLVYNKSWIMGAGDGQGGLTCCSSWGLRVGHDWATELNWTVFPCYKFG